MMQVTYWWLGLEVEGDIGVGLRARSATTRLVELARKVIGIPANHPGHGVDAGTV
ncbi:MAG TPA: hypothetical protein VGE83_09130 [Terracidiphilus sp.]